MTDPYTRPEALLAQQAGATWRAATACRASPTPASPTPRLLDEQWSAEAALTMASARSRAPRCCTTSATSSRACRAPTSPSSSATSSSATRASSCARCRWTTTPWRWTRSGPPVRAATTWHASTRGGTTGSSGRRRCSTTAARPLGGRGRHDAGERVRARVADLLAADRALRALGRAGRAASRRSRAGPCRSGRPDLGSAHERGLSITRGSHEETFQARVEAPGNP